MVGNTPNFGKYDILRCFLAIDKKVSRGILVERLGLGEGTLRSVLDILKEKGMLVSTRQGHSLSKKGEKLRLSVDSLISVRKAESRNIYPTDKKVALLVKGIGEIPVGYELRDVAVRNGALGAMLLPFKGKLQLPQMASFDLKEFEELFDYSDGDLLIVTFAVNYAAAENSAIAVAVSVNKKLEKLFSELV